MSAPAALSSQTAAALLQGASARLAAAGVPTPQREARRLMAAAAEPGAEVPMGRDAVAPPLAARFEAMLTRRVQREPLSHITGVRAFWGRPFHVTAAVLDPRPETETLVERALDGPTPSRILDLGTGSGCLAITLALAWPGAAVVASDCAPAALAVAAQNARALGVGDRVHLVEGSWWEPIEGAFDLIVSNPPYIAAAEVETLAPEVRLYEPRIALTPGADALAAYRAIAAGLCAHLTPTGRALFEVGAGQGPAVARSLTEKTGRPARLWPDLSGHLRVAEV